MKHRGHFLRQLIACSLVIFFTIPYGEAYAIARQGTRTGQRIQRAVAMLNNSQIVVSEPVPSAGITIPRKLSVDLDSFHQHTIAFNQQSDATPIAPQQNQNDSATPLGTAVAPYENTSGVAASRPAGAVIAPAKQRRTRSILIKVGVLVGACIAIGTVVALSAGSPSHSH